MLRNIGLIICALAVVALLGEGALRVWHKGPVSRYEMYPQGVFCEPHPVFGWLGRPRCVGAWPFGASDMEVMQVRMNAEGFWDRDHPREKPKGVRRILLLGDSFTIGYGVQESARFSSRLQEALPEPYETINMGMWGFSTGQELLVLQELGFKYQPDTVVLAMFLDDLFCSRLFSVNDGLYQKPRYRLSRDRPLTLHNVPVPNNHGPSRFWNFTVTRLSDLRNRLEVGGTAWRQGWISVFDRSFVRDNGFTLALLLLGRIHELCSSNGVKLLLTIIPYKDQIAGTLTQSPARGYGGIPAARLDWGLPQKVVKAYCRSRGIECLDLLPIMEAQPNPMGLFFQRDLHWTRRGNQVAADAVLQKLLSMEGAASSLRAAATNGHGAEQSWDR